MDTARLESPSRILASTVPEPVHMTAAAFLSKPQPKTNTTQNEESRE